MAPSADQHGEESTVAAPQSVQNTREERQKPKENERKVGESDSKRSLGEAEVLMFTMTCFFFFSFYIQLYIDLFSRTTQVCF